MQLTHPERCANNISTSLLFARGKSLPVAYRCKIWFRTGIPNESNYFSNYPEIAIPPFFYKGAGGISSELLSGLKGCSHLTPLCLPAISQK